MPCLFLLFPKRRDKGKERAGHSTKKDIQCFNLLLHIFGGLDALSDVVLVGQTGFCGECFV